MNGLGKPLRKKSDPKNRKNSRNQSEIAACEQKTVSTKIRMRESEFLLKQFSHSTSNLQQKISRRITTRFFAPLPVSA